MKKRIIKKINTSKRNFLTGSVALAGVAAATSVLPISIATANHEDSDPKGLPDFIKWKNRDALIVHSKKGIETHRSAIEPVKKFLLLVLIFFIILFFINFLLVAF